MSNPVLEAGSKECSKCRVAKAPEMFHRTTGGRLRADCRDCRNAVTAAWRSGATEMQAATMRRSHLKRKYGITVDEYEALLDRQGGVCAICGGEQLGRSLEIDHNHSCCPGDKSCGGCIRGLLCGKCNRGIGQLDDSVSMLRLAIAYLEGT